MVKYLGNFVGLQVAITMLSKLSPQIAEVLPLQLAYHNDDETYQSLLAGLTRNISALKTIEKIEINRSKQVTCDLADGLSFSFYPGRIIETVWHVCVEEKVPQDLMIFRAAVQDEWGIEASGLKLLAISQDNLRVETEVDGTWQITECTDDYAGKWYVHCTSQDYKGAVENFYADSPISALDMLYKKFLTDGTPSNDRW